MLGVFFNSQGENYRGPRVRNYSKIELNEKNNELSIFFKSHLDDGPASFARSYVDKIKEILGVSALKIRTFYMSTFDGNIEFKF